MAQVYVGACDQVVQFSQKLFVRELQHILLIMVRCVAVSERQFIGNWERGRNRLNVAHPKLMKYLIFKFCLM